MIALALAYTLKKALRSTLADTLKKALGSTLALPVPYSAVPWS